MSNIKEQQRFAELEYCMEQYFNSRLFPIMCKVKDDLAEKQAQELENYQNSTAGMLRSMAGSTHNLHDDSLNMLRLTGEWNSKTTEDYIEMCRKDISSSKEIADALSLLAVEWRNAVVNEIGREHYDELSSKLGNDLANAYMDYRMEQLMVDRLVKDRMPKSSMDYIIRKAASDSLLGISQSINQSPLDAEIEQRGEAAYRPSTMENGIGRTLTFGADVVTTGGFSSWGALAKLAGAEVVFAGLEHYADRSSKSKTVTIESCISQGVFGRDDNVFSSFRKDSKEIIAYKNEYILSLNERLKHSLNIPSKETGEWLDKLFQTSEYLSHVPFMKKEEEKHYDNVPLIVKPGCEEAYLEQQKEQEEKKKTKEQLEDVDNIKDEKDVPDTQQTEVKTEIPDKSNANGWDGLMSTFGLSDLGSVGKNLGYVVAMLPDILVGLFTGKSKSLNQKDNILPIASILIGLFTRNPLLKMVMIGMGGLNLLNKAGHESLERMDMTASDTGNRKNVQYKSYSDEALNPRITDPVIKGNNLIMDIDKIPCSVQLPEKVVDAYHSGALPLNTLANAILAKSDRMQVTLQNNYRTSDKQSEERERNIAIK